MAVTNIEKYASGTGERKIDINRRESPFKITNLCDCLIFKDFAV